MNRAILLCLSLAAIAGTSSGCQDESEISRLQNQVETLKREKRFALSGWNREEREVERLQSRLSLLRSDLESAEAESRQLQATVDDLSVPDEDGRADEGLVDCHPAYTSECLDLSYDYDCANNDWEDDGPGYVYGPVDLMEAGNDPYGLDSDGNGVGCEDF